MIEINKIFDSSKISEYQQALVNACLLSGLFSDSDVPYIPYRLAENIFCYNLKSDDLTRNDMSFDSTVVHNGIKYGIGVKTFVINQKNSGSFSYSTQKIAEFNKKGRTLSGKKNLELAKEISLLRNIRLNSDMKEYGVDKAFYHCILRFVDNTPERKKHLLLMDFKYEPIDIDNIRLLNDEDKVDDSLNDSFNNASITFTDGKGIYSYNLSKSTLFKRFYPIEHLGVKIPVLIAPNSHAILDKAGELLNSINNSPTPAGFDEIFLPLYSFQKGEKKVYEHSGLNQWNAKGRPRKFGEMYIQVPKFIHNNFPTFFPKNGKEFTLITPNGKEIKAKLCQGGFKALMSNPNTDLSEWFHPIILGGVADKIITYKHLEDVGKDSVRLEKIGDNRYYFSLAPIGSYDTFLSRH